LRRRAGLAAKVHRLPVALARVVGADVRSAERLGKTAEVSLKCRYNFVLEANGDGRRGVLGLGPRRNPGQRSSKIIHVRERSADDGLRFLSLDIFAGPEQLQCVLRSFASDWRAIAASRPGRS